MVFYLLTHLFFRVLADADTPVATTSGAQSVKKSWRNLGAK